MASITKFLSSQYVINQQWQMSLGSCLKQKFAILLILLLFSVSMISYAECWVKPVQSCASNAQSKTDRCHEVVSPQHARCSDSPVASGCQTTETCRQTVQPDDGKSCGQKHECRTWCYRLLPPLIADDPVRRTAPDPSTAEFGVVVLQSSMEITSQTAIRIVPPPFGIHLSIVTTVLRI